MLARKGSRLITIDGTQFRWTVAPDDGFIDIIAERAQEPGCRIEVQADYVDRSPDSLQPTEPPHRIISPAIMSHIITCALDLGWNPQEKGQPVRFRLDSDQTDTPRLIPWAQHSRSWTGNQS